VRERTGEGGRPAQEPDYDGPLLPEPEDPADRAQWLYGMGKRACEDVLVEAWEAERFPATRLRIPMVNGPRDPNHRVERYVARMLDGGPVIVPDGGAHRVRHVYVLDVVEAILKVLVMPWSAGQAYNYCQDESPRLAELLSLVAEALGAYPRLVSIQSAELTARGLDPATISPFSSRWMSLLDPTRSYGELGLRHRPLERWLEATVTACLAHPPAEPPPGYQRREEEIALARSAS
jgi:nucleoside-diphosphate-sugar epimerase